MKKLFALVLTLALVFAIAAPAMALSWGTTTDPTGSPYKAAVTQVTPSTDVLGNPAWAAYNTSIGVVAGSTVYFQVSFTIPSADDLAAYYVDPNLASTGAAAKIALKNLINATVEAQYVNGSEITTAGDKFVASDLTVDYAKMPNTTTGAAAKDYVYSVVIKASVEKTAEASVTASIGYTAATALPITARVGTKDYVFASSSIVDATSAADGSATITQGTNTLKLTLAKGTKNIVSAWALTVGSTTYTVKAGPTFLYTTGTAPNIVINELAATDAAFADVKAAYDGFAALLGFNPASTGISFTVANVAANYGVNNKASATATYKAYTANLTVTDGTNVPNTGDNMSVIGFVMVGLALLATAAVVVKKVRA